MASVTLLPSSVDEDNSSYYAISPNYPVTAIVDKDIDNNAYGVGVNLTRNSGGITNFYINFDTSEIPQDSIITNISCSIAIYGSSYLSQRTTERNVQLCKGTTGVGDPVSWTVDSGGTVVAEITNSGSWTSGDLNNLKALVQLVRNSTNATTNTYVYIRGARLVVEYDERPLVYHTVTTQAGDGVAIDKVGSISVAEGDSFELKITPNSSGAIRTVTDNGTDVIGKLQAVNSLVSGSATSYPTSYSTSGTSINGTRYRNCIGQSSDTTATGNDYSSGSSGSTSVIAYSFDFSSIPQNAVITSVTVKVGGHLENTTRSTANLELYSGNTLKGSQSKFTSTSKQVITMDAGTWTRAELQSAQLRFTIGYYGGLVNGVDFVVNYSVPGDGIDYYTYTIASVATDHTILVNVGSTGTRIHIKINGASKNVLKIFKLVNGRVVEVKDSDLDQNAKYRLVT